ncbi:MAG: peptidylprolyl isomerase [Gemmatimonadales bacterium]|nr:peptidylprolyl isomerase [Gemmatimonadales bacterium]
MMQAFRKVAGPMIVLLTVTLLAWMVLDLSGLTSTGGMFSRNAVGKVEGTPIDIRVFENAVQRTVTERQKQTPGRLGLDEQEQIRSGVFEEFVREVLLEKAMAQRGITTEDDEVVEAVRLAPPQEFQTSPEFQTEGRFDIQKYQRWLVSSAARPYVDQLAGQYRRQLMQGKLFRAVSADVFPSDAALWQRYRDEREQVTVGVAVGVPAAPPGDSTPGISDADAEQYFAAHRDEFTRKKTAYLSAIQVSRLPDASDSAAALERARRLRAEVVGGAPFAEVAQRESSDSGSAKRGGDLGEWTYGQMVKEFDAAAQVLPIGQVSEPVRSQFGYHIIQMESRTGQKRKGRHILVPIELAGAHRDAVDAKADSLDRLSIDGADAAAFDKAAKAVGAEVVRATPTPQGARVRLGLLEVPDAGTWAFTAEPGAISPVIETSYAYFVFRLDSLAGEGTPSFASVKAEARRAAWIAKEKARVRQAAAAAAEQAARGVPLKDAAAAAGLTYSAMGPFSRAQPPFREPALIGAAFGVGVGKATGVLDTKEAVYVLTGIARQPADSAAFVADLPRYRNDVSRSLRSERIQGYVQALRKAAKVEDNREELYRQTATARPTS